MKRYDDYILGELLDKYERSSLFRGENQRRVSVLYRLTPKELPEYFDITTLEYENIHSQLLALEAEGLVTLVWKKGREGQVLEKCILVTDNAGAAYQRLGRPPKDEKAGRLLRILGQYENSLPAFVRWARERIEKFQTLSPYLDYEQPSQAERTCLLAFKILTNENRLFLRQFSVRCFGDSKAAEKEIAAAVRILANFERRDLLGLEPQEVLEEFLIFKNPSWIMLKGGPYAESFPGGFGVTEEDVQKLVFDPARNITDILTIENLTSFHQWQPETDFLEGCGEIEERKESKTASEVPRKASLVIYLGGYANRAKREFLQRLREIYPRARFWHCGDIDCGGFRIWKSLCEGTGIYIRPCRMDIDTYRTYLPTGRPLTDHDRKELLAMGDDPFYEGQRDLFREMLAQGVKLEQESFL